MAASRLFCHYSAASEWWRVMLDFSWSELAVIGTVALVCIGPKDLPKAMRAAGMFMRKARQFSREFQHGFEQMLHEAELQEAHETLKAATRLDIEREAEKIVDPKGELAEAAKPPEFGMPALETKPAPDVKTEHS